MIDLIGGELLEFYRGKNVLITGHTGFKGSWLAVWLKELGANVIGIALDPVSEKDLFNLASLSGEITDYRQDIRDLAIITQIIQKEQPEIVFHLAAQPLVLSSYHDPVLTFETNVLGTVNILEACRKTKSVRQIVIVTTDKVYENKEQLAGYEEVEPLGGHDPYSASKAASEIITQSYSKSFFQSTSHLINSSVSTARAGNVIGGGDWSQNRIIPDCIRSLEKNKTIVLRNPGAVRPWQHVLEPLNGYLLLAIKMAEDPEAYSGAWNFGPQESEIVSVRELVGNVLDCWGEGKWEAAENIEKPHETEMLKLNISKSRNYLGWKPVLNLNETVELTIDWYKKYSTTDVYQLCLENIKEFSIKWNSLKEK